MKEEALQKMNKTHVMRIKDRFYKSVALQYFTDVSAFGTRQCFDLRTIFIITQ